MLHRVASQYGTDPATVLTWDAFRFGLAVACVEQALASRNAASAGVEGIMPVLDLGRW